MDAKTKRGMMTAGGIMLGAAAGGAAAMFAGKKLIADDPAPACECDGKVLPAEDGEEDDEEHDDGDIFAEVPEPTPESAEDVFVKNASMPSGDHHDPDYTPEV